MYFRTEKAILDEPLDDFTNEEELGGSLVAVEVSKEDCWIIDLKMAGNEMRA